MPRHRGCAVGTGLRRAGSDATGRVPDALPAVAALTARARRRLPAGLAAGGEHELAVLEVDVHVVAGVQLAVQDPLAEPVLDLVLHRAAQRPGAERRVEADLDELLLGGAR